MYFKNKRTALFHYIESILKSQITPGILLVVSGLLAICFANSEYSSIYTNFINHKITIQVYDLFIDKTFIHWVNELLMPTFFLIVGLEIKREFSLTSIEHKTKIFMLPAFCAIGGVIVPALIFLSLNPIDNIIAKGWAIPTATDIAFALGVLLLLGSRVPQSLKVLLTSIAIFDDLIAIFIIGVWYSSTLSFWYIFYSSLICLLLMLLNYYNVRKITPYIIVGVILWFCMQSSGIHATITGFLVAIFIPSDKLDNEKYSPLYRLERNLYHLVYIFILPIFAFTNSGIIFPEGSFSLMLSNTLLPLPLGIALGLFLGKQIGIFGFGFIAIKLKLATLPKDIDYSNLFGVAVLSGIGFTMSLLIATLAYYPHPGLLMLAKFGILFGSIISAITGYYILKTSLQKNKLKILK